MFVKAFLLKQNKYAVNNINNYHKNTVNTTANDGGIDV